MMTDEPQEQALETEAGDDALTEALESTLEGLNRSIAKMEELVRQIEAGDPGWEDSVRMLEEANALAVSSSQQLDQVVQDVVYGEMEVDATEESAGAAVEDSDTPVNGDDAADADATDADEVEGGNETGNEIENRA